MPFSSTPHWTAYVTAFAVPVVAVIASYVAYRQWRTANDKVRLDLFDRRLAVYQAVRDVIGAVTRSAVVSQEEQLEFLRRTQSARWLFGSEIEVYLTEMWHKIVDLDLHRSMIYDGGAEGEERQKHVMGKAETLKWFVAQRNVLDQKCSSYLSFGHLK